MDEQSEVDVASPRVVVLPGAPRRPAATVVTIGLVSVLIMGGATALVVGLTRGRPIHPAGPAAAGSARPSAAAACPSSIARAHATDSTRIGRWPFRVVQRGRFGSVVGTGSGGVFAIEACGPFESDLRVVRMNLERRQQVRAGAFVHGALLTSSLVSTGRALYLGAARLDLGGPTTSPPYELTIYRLDPVTLDFTASRALGRGYGLTLETDGAGLVATTGSSLLAIDESTLASRLLESFGQSVAQHIANDPITGQLVVGLFTPGAVPPSAGARIEVLSGQTGHVVSTIALPDGADPESLVLAGGRLWAAVGNGMTTMVHLYDLGSRTSARTGRPPTGRTTLRAAESLTLNSTSPVVWTSGLSVLRCNSATSGNLLGDTTQSGPAPVLLTQVFDVGSTIYAVSPEGIGRLSAPAACTP